MSYDLMFSSEGLPSLDEVRAYFSGRPHYEVSESQAWYENPTTGVSFSFGLHHGEGRLELSFNLNYSRPSFFGLEAEPEVATFIARFGLSVEDPQADGMGSSPYSREGFLRGWNAGNRFGVHVAKSEGVGLLSLPEAVNTGIWRWNQVRESYLDRLGSVEMLPTFVPTVTMLMAEHEPEHVTRVVVWGQAMAFMLPEVDRIILMQADKSMLWIPYAELAPHLESRPLRPASYTFELGGTTFQPGLAHRVIEDNLTEGPIFELLIRGGEPLPKLSRIAPGQIVDAELLG